MPDLPKVFTKNVRRLAEEKGWSDKELAKRIGIGTSQMSKLLGKKGNPTLQMVNRFCDALNVSPDNLFIDPDKPHLKHARMIGESLIDLVDGGTDPSVALNVVLKLFADLRRIR